MRNLEMAMASKDDGFTRMESSHFDAVKSLDSRCNEGVFPAKGIRSAIRDSANRAFVNLSGGKVNGFVVFSIKRNPGILHIERFAADSVRSYDTIFDALFYICDGIFDHQECECINIAVPFNNLTLRGKLIEKGFSVGQTKGSGDNRKIYFSKIMIESTWSEGTHYPLGTMVIEEIMGGSCRVLGHIV